MLFLVSFSAYGYSCKGGGYVYTSEVYSEVYTYHSVFGKNASCEKQKSQKPITKKIDKIKNDLDTQIENFYKNCGDFRPDVETLRKSNEAYDKEIVSANKSRKEKYFTDIKNKKSRFEAVWGIDGEKDIDGIHLNSNLLADTAILCRSSDISKKMQPYWRFIVDIKRRAASYRFPELHCNLISK